MVGVKISYSQRKSSVVAGVSSPHVSKRLKRQDEARYLHGTSFWSTLSSCRQSIQELIILDLIRQAVELNEKGVKTAKKPAAERKELIVPDELATALETNSKAKAALDAFRYSHKRNTSNGLPRQRPKRQEIKGSPPRWNGFPKAKAVIGNMRIVEDRESHAE